MTMRCSYRSLTIKRSVLFIISALCLLQVAVAQVAPVDITVQLVPPYTSRIVDYVSPGNEKLRVISLQRDLTQANYRFFLRMEVSVNGQVLFRTSRNWQPAPITVAPGTPVILDGADLQPYFDVNHLDFVSFDRDRYITNPNLPEGFTTICMTAYDYNRPDVAVSTTYCANYFLTLPEPPMLNYPACGMQLRALSPQQILFSWVPMNMGNAASQSTVYELSLYENRDNRNPNDIVQNVTPIYTNRSTGNTVVYGPGEPALQTGMSYVWRVQAIDEKGQQAFKNNGFSQPCNFTYSTDSTMNWNNAQPLQIYALAMNEKNAKIGWTPDKDIAYEKYTVYYRKKGNDNNWFNNTLTDTVYFVSNLEENTTYETRVQGIKGASSGMYSPIVTFTTPQRKAVDCKEGAGILAPYNGRPYLKAMHNDIVHYGSFELTLDRVQPLQPGYYSGTGTVTIPFLMGMTLSVTFNNIQIGDDMQVTAGDVIFDSEGVDAWRNNTPVANTVIKNLSDGIKQLVNSTVKDDDAQWKDLVEKVKELATKELPQTLLDDLNTALTQMEDARIDYKEAQQEYNNATTAQEKQEAQTKMEAADKEYKEAQESLDKVSKQKDELVNGVTDIILEAIKKIRQEKDSLIKSVEAFNQDVKAFNQEMNAAQGIDDANQAGADILMLDDYADEVNYNDEARAAFLQKASELLSRKKTLKKAIVYKIFIDFFSQPDNLSTNLISDKKINGKDLVDQLIKKQTDKESKDAMLTFAHDYLVKVLEDYILSLDQK